jgi:hypothetical protein
LEQKWELQRQLSFPVERSLQFQLRLQQTHRQLIQHLKDLHR